MTDPKEVRRQVSPDTFPTDQAAQFTLEGFYGSLIQGLTDKYLTVFESFGRKEDGAVWLKPDVDWSERGKILVYTSRGIFEVAIWKGNAVGRGYEEDTQAIHKNFQDEQNQADLVASIEKNAKEIEHRGAFEAKVGDRLVHVDQLPLHSTTEKDRKPAIERLKRAHELAVQRYNQLQESERQRPKPEELLEEL